VKFAPRQPHTGLGTLVFTLSMLCAFRDTLGAKTIQKNLATPHITTQAWKLKNTKDTSYKFGVTTP